MDGANHMEIAARAVAERKPVPEIDFTLHTMEDGTQVSTQERVCKGTMVLHTTATDYFALTHNFSSRGPGAGFQSSLRRAVSLSARSR